MYDEKELCDKISQIYPDIGECGIDVKVGFDNENEAYTVDLTKGKHHLKTFLETEDADTCMAGKHCIGLGIQIAQLRANIENV